MLMTRQRICLRCDLVVRCSDNRNGTYRPLKRNLRNEQYKLTISDINEASAGHIVYFLAARSQSLCMEAKTKAIAYRRHGQFKGMLEMTHGFCFTL
jgi:hypothetical protein